MNVCRMVVDFEERCTVWFSQSRRWNPSEVAMLTRISVGSVFKSCYVLARTYLLKLNLIHFLRDKGMHQSIIFTIPLIEPLRPIWRTKSQNAFSNRILSLVILFSRIVNL